MRHKIAPSLLSADFGRLAEEIHKVTDAGANILHLDIMDGHFVPNLTYGLPVVKAISQIAKIPLDAHLMVTNPDFYIEPFADLGVNYFSFHIEAVQHAHRIVEKIKSSGMKAGIALNPATHIINIEYLLADIDFVLIMSVNPGFSGQKFIEFCLPKVELLKNMKDEKKLNFEIELDGGVNAQNIASIVSSGVDIAVAGASVFSSSDYSEAIRNLKVGCSPP